MKDRKMCGFNWQKPRMIIYAKLQSSRVRHQYGIFGGKSQTSFTRNATRAGGEEGRLFSQAINLHTFVVSIPAVGHVQSIKFSYDRKILAIQRSLKIVVRGPVILTVWNVTKGLVFVYPRVTVSFLGIVHLISLPVTVPCLWGEMGVVTRDRYSYM